MTPDLSKIVFIDSEIGYNEGMAADIGAVKGDGAEFHSGSASGFAKFIQGCKYICGHNILEHDAKYLEKEIFGGGHTQPKTLIDTLYLSPLLFPKKPYHRLIKDDKLAPDELNNPLNDAKKARDLFFDMAAEFESMDGRMRDVYAALLYSSPEFNGFYRYAGYRKPDRSAAGLVREAFAGKICEKAPIKDFAAKSPIELAYALSQIAVIDTNSVTPPWVLLHYSRVENILHLLRNVKCKSCAYCREFLDETKALKKFFDFGSFRIYDGMPLQRSVVKAAIDGKSLLAIFPTAGGKSITFQLPALMAGVNEKGLTVVLSPLQSLMKDQTDKLESEYNITESVTINGSLDPLERVNAFERVEDGSASILYIAPESLRSHSIERLLLKRNVVRFVIDEAHCFSVWGQDFRVDYLYIGDFIRNLQQSKGLVDNIPVSCFTATAKKEVITDICDYFKSKLSVEMEVFRANVARPNLSYHIINAEDDDDKYYKLRRLISGKDCPVIIYVSRTRRTSELANSLTADGYPACHYHGQLDRGVRIANQEAFMKGEVNIIVATTAFGMGVDKKDVGMVIHYDISDSLENYVQEAGRAGRDENIRADCYVLFNDEDLVKHFTLLNQTKMSHKEIQQVWRALKEITRIRANVSQSALEIARLSGWDDSVEDMETRVTTAINALEQSGFVKRGQNMPRIFADSILVRNMEEARALIDGSARFDDQSRKQAARIMNSLISARSKSRGRDGEGETRVDYLSDRLGIDKRDVIAVIGLLREEGILADAKDLVAYIKKGGDVNRPENVLAEFIEIEGFIYSSLSDAEGVYSIKKMNEALQVKRPGATINQLKTALNYLIIKKAVQRTHIRNKDIVTLKPLYPAAELIKKCDKRFALSKYIIENLYAAAALQSKRKAPAGKEPGVLTETRVKDEISVEFSVLGLKNEYDNNYIGEKIDTREVEDALFYLTRIGALKIEGGFLVTYNALRLERLKLGPKTKYTKEHYAQLDAHYQNKRRQIHIVGEYANRMVSDYRDAMEFTDDYFTLDYETFVVKYFPDRREEIDRNITPKKFKQLFGELSAAQLRIINSRGANCIVVAAGPGSGKTRILTHKLASLYMMEDVKHEQMLMLTFSRAAATEFKKRLIGLIGNAAHFIQITTFHSFCFDLLGKTGDLDKSDQIVRLTVEKIKNGEADSNRLTKTVLVIDEAQDMSADEYSLIKALMENNEDMRVIAVGDDDQNIYGFRGSDSAYFKSLLAEPGAKRYELVENYRSAVAIVDFANNFAAKIPARIKTMPIISRVKEKGSVSLCRLATENIAIPAVNAYCGANPAGSSCIIARTNEEVLSIAGLLLKRGVTAKQVRTNGDFNLYNLAELRDFTDVVCAGGGHAISDDVWRKSMLGLQNKYANSDNLPDVLRLLGEFEKVNGGVKFKNDLKRYVLESRLDDFFTGREGTVLVSTIHQTKGKEFDNVFFALSRFPKMDGESMRAVYVAITRAKRNLHILCGGSYFDNIATGAANVTTDGCDYPQPEKLVLQLNHKDVALGYFAYRRRFINGLLAGDELLARDDACYLGETPVLKYSAKFRERVEALKAKGYLPAKAFVRYVVFWRDPATDIESKIVLPEIEFHDNRDEL